MTYSHGRVQRSPALKSLVGLEPSSPQSLSIGVNTMRLASVSDANGSWGTSTGLFTTTGGSSSSMTKCTLEASSGSSADVDQDVPPPPKSHKGIISGALIGGVLGLIALALLGFAAVRWRRLRARAQKPEPAFIPEAWTGSGTIAYHRVDSASSASFDMTGLHRKPQLATRQNAPDRPSRVPNTLSRLRSIVYHRDGGAVIGVPPPYVYNGLDTSLLPPSTSTSMRPDSSGSDIVSQCPPDTSIPVTSASSRHETPPNLTGDTSNRHPTSIHLQLPYDYKESKGNMKRKGRAKDGDY